MPINDEQVVKIMETLGKLDERTENIEKAVLGNGQPGLAQKVEELEAHKNRTIGGVAVLSFLLTAIWGWLEYTFHLKK